MIPTHLERFTTPIPVLDQGFLRLVDLMGDDGSVVTAARVTTGKGRSDHVWGRGLDALARHVCTVCKKSQSTSGYPDYLNAAGEFCLEGDRRLIRYMLANAHSSPFDFTEITFHFRCPVYVFRQWVRHWSWCFQEYSMRYSPAIDAMQATHPNAWRGQSTMNRQGSMDTVTTWPVGFQVDPTWELPPDALPGEYLSARERRLHAESRDVYEERLQFGVAKEQARKDLPLSNYTDVFGKANLRDLLNFLALRLDEHAQQEIREYAKVIAEIVKVWVPVTWEAFVDYRLEAHTFSRQALVGLRHMAQTYDPARLLEACGEMSTREQNDLLRALCIDPVDRTGVS